jgi:hypothetical protein
MEIQFCEMNISLGGEEIPPGGWRSAEDTYRTKDGEVYFKFRFYPVGNYYEIDIIAMPSYGNRVSDLHTTHRLPSERGGNKVCFADPSIVTDLSTAKKWAAMWAEHTWKYIKNGTPFPNT